MSTFRPPARISRRLGWDRWQRHLSALLPGLTAVGLMLLWAAHDGGYDADTWYWGALMLLAALTVVVIVRTHLTRRLSPWSVRALSAFALYVVWSYLSILWAQAPGVALQGSNRALLYLILFALLTVLPWATESALIALSVFTLGVGLIGFVIILRLASADQVGSLISQGRLSAPTGYFNASAALFTIEALCAISLAARRSLPGVLRGLFIACACAGLQLALIAQSRGWLFTLPLVILVSLLVVPERLRFVAAAVLPTIAVALPAHRLLQVFESRSSPLLAHSAQNAGRTALVLCVSMFVLGTLLAWTEKLVSLPTLSRARGRQLGTFLVALALVGAGLGTAAATHGHPVSFLKRQWHGFTRPTVATAEGSHFATVGSGRYDFWRVALDGALAHPVGGLGQDNFADYYLKRRRTAQEPVWTHSLELRLLVHTGFVGFALFAAFLITAIGAALGARRDGSAMTRAVAATSLLPLVVWLIHGSVDWFWEMPALTGPALGFLAVAGALRPDRASRPAQAGAARWRMATPVVVVAGAVSLVAAVIALGLPYLSVREVSIATDASSRQPAAALREFQRAGQLNPLSADPGQLGGALALQTGRWPMAEHLFAQSISREPGAWFSWLGAGLAASSLGERGQAHHDFEVAISINSQQPPVRAALARVYTSHPLTYAEALELAEITQ